MFTHIVLMRFPRIEVALEAAQRLRALASEIDVVQGLVAGVDTASPGTYSLGLVVTLDSEDDLEEWSSHPAHENVASFVREHRIDAVRCNFNSE